MAAVEPAEGCCISSEHFLMNVVAQYAIVAVDDLVVFLVGQKGGCCSQLIRQTPRPFFLFFFWSFILLSVFKPALTRQWAVLSTAPEGRERHACKL